MARKRKTLIENLQEIIDSGDLDAFKAVFDKCEISATHRGNTTTNVLSYKGLTPAHITFLVENGIDVNADAGWGMPPVFHQAYSLENLQCLIAHGADINLTVKEYRGNALFYATEFHMAQYVRNLLLCGAVPNETGGWFKDSALDACLRSCRSIEIINTLDIARMLLDAGLAEKTEKSAKFVREIGEKFEFMRPDFNPDTVDQYSQALDELYALFDVEPVPKRVIYDGKSRITVLSDTWQKQHEELWNMLVPGKGAANTVQGELIRISGRLANEILDNGSINWDEDFRKMAKAMVGYFHSADGMDAALIEEACALSQSISSHSDEKKLYRLTELAVKWVIANPEPIALKQVDYNR